MAEYRTCAKCGGSGRLTKGDVSTGQTLVVDCHACGGRGWVPHNGGSEHRQNAPCQRCGNRPHSWFWDGGYVCSPCMDEWTVFKRYVLDNVPRIGGPGGES